MSNPEPGVVEIPETGILKPPEFRKTIVLGLGGSGRLILTHLKRLFIDTYGAVPPSIRLLCLDTDVAAVRVRSREHQVEYSLKDQEFLHLRVEDPVTVIESSEIIQKWYIMPVPVGSITSGAGGVRQNGRLAFFAHLDDILRRLDRLVSDLGAATLPDRMRNAKQELGAKTDFRLSGRKPEIYVCGSLAGGTGSGTFLDAGILLRHLLPRALIHGFFMLDWIYRNKPFGYRFKGNVYAALAELDNVQSIMYGDGNFTPYDVQYTERLHVTVQQSPYDLCHLLDGRNEADENIDDVGKLAAATADAIFLSVGPLGDQVNSVADNLLRHIHTQPPRIWNYKYARYSSLGVSSIYYPAREFHRLASRQLALRLCQAALRETADTPGSLVDRGDVGARMDALQLNRLNVRQRVCPFHGSVSFEVEPFQIADPAFPDLLRQAQSGEEENLVQKLRAAHEGDGARYIADSADALREQVAAIRGDPARGAAYLNEWIDQVVEHLAALEAGAVQEQLEAAQSVDARRRSAADLLDIATQATYRPYVGALFGDPRTDAAKAWGQEVEALLEAIRKQQLLDYERAFYAATRAALTEDRPQTVPTRTEITGALLEAEHTLAARAAEAGVALDLLMDDPTQIVIGNGAIIIIPDELRSILPAAGESVAVLTALELDYGQFKEETGLHTADSLLKLYHEDRAKLPAAFLTYCERKLERLLTVTVYDALQNRARKRIERGEFLEPEEFIQQQFDDLFRKASALWSFNPARLNQVQKPHYDKIINLGVHDAGADAGRYEPFVRAVKGRYGVEVDHSYATTRDPYRIWLLNYAATLPLYFLSDLQAKKEQYEEEISPSYHVDSRLEMETPDLFPEEDEGNRVLRMLAMAIVPGVDVIHDLYLRPLGGRGHKFTFDTPEIRQRYSGDPKVWGLFRDMYREVRMDGELQATLRSMLTEKVARLKLESPDELKENIERHVARMRQRLADRNVSRLISARLIYEEVRELERFLDRRGYGQDIGRYVGGMRGAKVPA